MGLFNNKNNPISEETVNQCLALVYYTIDRLALVVNYHRIFYTGAAANLGMLIEPKSYPGTEQFKFKLQMQDKMAEQVKGFKQSKLIKFDHAANTGACYANGWGVEQDIETAKKYFIKAARCDKSDGKCRFIVGNYFRSGIYFELDEKKGFFWIESAALIDYADAIVQLGELYYNGIGCKKNIDKARFCWETAAEAQIPDAILKLSICYETGECGFPISASKANELCLEAAELGSSEAQIKCALSFLTDDDPTEEDYQEAFAWLEKANALNNAHAKYILAGFYYEGIVVEESVAKALELYKEAYDLGVSDAASDIVGCYKYGGNDLLANVEAAKKYASEYEVDYDEI